MSSEDVEKGARWAGDIASQLREARVGILCLTHENLHAPWLLFEAGALSKTLDSTFVIPYLFQLVPSDLEGPLVQFQAAVANEGDTLRMIQTINGALGASGLTDATVQRFFSKWWPDLVARLDAIPKSDRARQIARSDRALLEEILEVVRDLNRDREGPAQRLLRLAPPYAHLAARAPTRIVLKDGRFYDVPEEPEIETAVADERDANVGNSPESEQEGKSRTE